MSAVGTAGPPFSRCLCDQHIRPARPGDLIAAGDIFVSMRRDLATGLAGKANLKATGRAITERDDEIKHHG